MRVKHVAKESSAARTGQEVDGQAPAIPLTSNRKTGRTAAITVHKIQSDRRQQTLLFRRVQNLRDGQTFH